MKYIVTIITLLSILGASEYEEIKRDYFKSYDYEQMQKYNEAIKVLSPLYSKYPKGYTLNLRFGWLFYLDKKYADAIEHYKKASLINQYALEPKLGLIRIYLATSSSQKAQTLAYEILKVDYYNFYANLYAIQSLIAQNKTDIALEIIRKMLSIYPTNITFLEQLFIVYKQTNSEYLQSVYEDILILDPNNVLVRSYQK